MTPMKHFTSFRASEYRTFMATMERQRSPDPQGRNWYTIQNASKDEAEIVIYDEIGFWGVSAQDFVNDLSEVTSKTINLRINSPGGEVFDGMAIHAALKRHSATVNVFVDGLAASIASVIAMAGDTVTMAKRSQMMIHEATGFAFGNAADMQKTADVLNQISDNIAGIYADHAGGVLSEWRDRMKAETWMTDQQAVDLGLADRIEEDDQDDVDNRAQRAQRVAALGLAVVTGDGIVTTDGTTTTNATNGIMEEIAGAEIVVLDGPEDESEEDDGDESDGVGDDDEPEDSNTFTPIDWGQVFQAAVAARAEDDFFFEPPKEEAING